MKVEYVNPFVEAAFKVLEAVLKHKPTKGGLAMQPATFTSHQCNVVTGVTGSVQGSVIYGMSLATADKVAGTMLGHEIKVFDQLASSAIAELGNMLSGNAMAFMSEKGFQCDMTPPTIIRGTTVKISTLNIPAVVIPLQLKEGELFITVGLQERK
jgi:chemotaxis protein CheX